jgi:DNA-binding MarR family transcriptional regulator
MVTADKSTAVQSRGAAESDDALNVGVLRDLLGYGLRRAQVRAFQDFAVAMSPFEVSPGQLGVLLLVDANPGVNQSALARAMGLDRSTIVAVIDRLERRDLVSREPSPDDRRSHALVLTRTGRKFLSDVRPHLERHEARLAGDLSEAERKTLTSLLNRINGI